MCTGSGGGDGGVAEREAGRQKEQNSAIARINSLFGVSDDSLVAPTRPNENINVGDTPMIDGMLGGVSNNLNDQQYNNDLTDYNNSLELNKKAEANKEKLGTIYSGVGDDVSTYLTKDLNDQYEVAERSGRFNAARRGVRGGSSELDLSDNVNEEYDKGALNVSNRASDASAKMRTTDSNTRLDMIQRILSGMSGDAAIVSAHESMKNSSENIRRNSLAQSLDNIFSDTAYVNKQNQIKSGAQRANDYYNSTYYSSPKSYSGRVN